MAWIKCTEPAVQELYAASIDVMDEPVGFSDNSTAQVSEELAEAMCDHYDSVRPYEGEE